MGLLFDLAKEKNNKSMINDFLKVVNGKQSKDEFKSSWSSVVSDSNNDKKQEKSTWW